jgi:4-diphosphocytidyl-2-C-methyl-D-erythritol kinase
LVYFSPCKINIGLQVLNKREDGFHNIETIFYNIPLYDIIEVLPANDFSFIQTGIPLYIKPSENICEMAFQLFKKAYPKTPNVYIHLHKIIPSGAGLGGGSANAAIVLKALNAIISKPFTNKVLQQMALQLGSDCPFFLETQPCIGKGRGEQLTPVTINLHGYYIYIVNPGIHIRTPWAFEQVKTYPSQPNNIQQVLLTIPKQWQQYCFNDFELPVFQAHPEIEVIKNTLYTNGALYASMSGSGSTVYGIFEQKPMHISFPKNYLVIERML